MNCTNKRFDIGSIKKMLVTEKIIMVEVKDFQYLSFTTYASH